MHENISLVVPVYNRAWYLERSLASLTQTRLSPRRYEIIVVDDGSCDQTEIVAATYAASFPVRYLRIREGGEARNCCFARNAGIEASRYSLVATTDPEILFVDDVLLRATSRFADESSIYLTAGGFVKLDRVETLKVGADGVIAKEMGLGVGGVMRAGRPAWLVGETETLQLYENLSSAETERVRVAGSFRPMRRLPNADASARSPCISCGPA